MRLALLQTPAPEPALGSRDGDDADAVDAVLPRGRVRPWPNSAAALVLVLVHGEPGHAAVGIRHHPVACRVFAAPLF
jgi:hypothetical protein